MVWWILLAVLIVIILFAFLGKYLWTKWSRSKVYSIFDEKDLDRIKIPKMYMNQRSFRRELPTTPDGSTIFNPYFHRVYDTPYVAHRTFARKEDLNVAANGVRGNIPVRKLEFGVNIGSDPSLPFTSTPKTAPQDERLQRKKPGRRLYYNNKQFTPIKSTPN